MSATRLGIGTFPGLDGGLLASGTVERESYEEYVARGGYAPTGSEGEELLEQVERAELRGRGGAAFPAGLKMRAVRDRPGRHFLVINGEEGEPASIKDRWLLCRRPHLVLDGALRTAACIGAERLHVLVSEPTAERAIGAALRELPRLSLAVEVNAVGQAYVAGEETAVVRFLGGGPALPLDKPPRPFEAGLEGEPTLVANVETMANVPAIATADADALLRRGGSRRAGTILITVTGAVDRPGLYEVPLGVSVGEAIEAVAGLRPRPRGFLMGGFFAGLLGPRGLEARLGYDELREEGSGLGCGAIVVLGAEECPLAVATEVMDFFERENAKQCGACIRGTESMLGVLRSLGGGSATEAEVERLRGWSSSLRGRGACSLLDGAATLAGTLVREFPTVVAEHLAGSPCGACADLQISPRTRFQTSIDQFEKGR